MFLPWPFHPFRRGRRRRYGGDEAPHKLLATLKDLDKIVGNRKICLARELTKLHEERKYTDIESLINEVEEIVRGGL